MTTSEEQLQEWEALVPRLNDDADDHMDVAHSADMRPEHTANYRHAKNAHEAAYAIHSLIAELRETMESLRAGLEQLGKERSRALAAESDLAATKAMLASKKILIESAEAKLAETEKDAQRYRWLTDDHCNWTTRQACRDILCWMPVMSYSVASAAIDAAIAAKEKP